jgi:MerR family transcriptional regulator/heat shock protein HspR
VRNFYACANCREGLLTLWDIIVIDIDQETYSNCRGFLIREIGDDCVAYFHGPNDPVYTIGVAARLLSVTPQFLRQIENEGLILPARTDSNIRLYSDSDLRLLARIIYLWRHCGINPQGIRVIMAMEEGDSKDSSYIPRRRFQDSAAKEENQGRVEKTASRDERGGLVKDTH